MTNHRPNFPRPDGDDALELASAYLDGEATPDEVARVEADPALDALVVELESVRDELASVDAPAGLVDDQLTAAMAEFDSLTFLADDPDGPHTAPPEGSVDTSTTVQHLRDQGSTRWYQRVPLGAVAAAVVAVALFGALTQIDTGSDDDSVATQALDAEDSGGDSEDFTESQASGSGTATEGSAGAGADDEAAFDASSSDSDRVIFDDTDGLVGFVAETVLGQRTGDDAPPEPAPTVASSGDSFESAPADGTDEAAACDPVAAVRSGDENVVAVVPAVVAGADQTAVVIEDGEGRRVLVVDETSCSVVDERPI